MPNFLKSPDSKAKLKQRFKENRTKSEAYVEMNLG